MTYNSADPEHRKRNQAYQRKWYLANKEKQCARSQAQKIKQCKRNRQVLLEYYARGCVDCGETDPIVLEFDHVRGEKTNCISILCHRVVSVEHLREELDKCDVICRNCHARRTCKTQGWWKERATDAGSTPDNPMEP